METFFKSESRIKSWLEQIIEKIFTVCLLKGTDSDFALEFTKGRQLVVKIAMLLTDTSSLPKSVVFDAILELLEQRLPDQRIIDNFPNFYQVMKEMIREGIAIVEEDRNPFSEQSSESLDTKDYYKQPILQKPTSVIILAGGREPMLVPRNLGSYMTIHRNQEESIQNLIADQSEKTSIVQTLLDMDMSIPEELHDIPVLAALADSSSKNNFFTSNSKQEKLMPIFEDSTTEIITSPKDKEMKAINYNQRVDLDDSKPPLTRQTSSLNVIENNVLSNCNPLATTSELVQLKLNIETSVGESTPTEAEYGVPLPLVEVGVSRLDERNNTPEEQLKPTDIELPKKSSKDLPLSKNRVRSSSLVPKEATRLALVLQQIFPNTQARWNFKLGEYNFLVQIKDLLVYLETLSEGNRVEKEMKKEGWRIIVCSAEDLCFPRRLERAIQRVLKSSK